MWLGAAVDNYSRQETAYGNLICLCVGSMEKNA
jgi:hypothetical protein